jgi:hypothetical protein
MPTLPSPVLCHQDSPVPNEEITPSNFLNEEPDLITPSQIL